MANLRTLGDLNKDKNQKNKDNRESYVGGEKSGLLVEDGKGSKSN